MAENPSRKRGFPPGIGWLPYTIAVVAALIVGSIAVIPQFGTKVVGVQPVNGSGIGGSGDTGSGSSGGASNGGAGGSTTTGGKSGSAGKSGGKAGAGASATPAAGIDCSKGQNGGATGPGVTATQIRVASTIVSRSSSSPAQGFLGEASDGMQAAIQQFNNAGGHCGRKITDLSGNNGISTLNDDWIGQQGNTDISGWVNSSSPPFALVGEPDSEGLDTASKAGTIDHAQIPVVGSDGMLASQYHDPWIFPVASSTVSNMHIIADYAVHTLHASSFGIVFDNQYKFGKEGADAFAQELQRLGAPAPTGYSPGATTCTGAFCGVDPTSGDYSNQILAFNNACTPCGVVVLLLETKPAETWMNGESHARTNWYTVLEGGEPLFDYNLGSNCGGCGGTSSNPGPLHVWTGYCASGVTDPAGCNAAAVSTFCQALHAVNNQDDCQNEFTEGAYLGTLLFIQAIERVDQANLPLTRANLQTQLNTGSYDLGLSLPLSFASNHIANFHMASYKDNYSGSFNGWTYDSTDFIKDPAPGSDL
jgi:hypothetical protein